MTVGQRIKNRRKELGISADELATAIGVSRSTMFRYEKGDIEKVPGDVLVPISKALHTTPAYLMGWEDIPGGAGLPSNVTRLEPMEQVPLVGQIACGTPILAEENIEDYVDLPRQIKADFALLCKGDSMTGAGIQDGDVVYIRQQVRVENGEIAAVLVGDDEATLKRFYYDGKAVQLVAENPKFPPLVFTGDEIQTVQVIGRAVAFTHSLV